MPATNNIEARIRELHEDGVDRELAFPNAVLALFHFPDKNCANAFSVSTTSTSPICRNALMVTSSVWV